MSEILAIDALIKTNADLIWNACALGYVDIKRPVLDATYGEGRFWRRIPSFDPSPRLFANDTDPAKGNFHYDYTRPAGDGGFPCEWDQNFDTVVFDPPYKLNGTSTGKGASALDDGYGVGGEYVTVEEKMGGIYAGICHCDRVLAPGGHLLVKCQDQVVSGNVVWQTHTIHEWGRRYGLRLIDRLELLGYRPQPSGRRQLHARRNHSTLLVFEKPKR